MDALTAATALGAPLGTVGAAFYFSTEAVARAEGIGLDVVSLYAAGRGAVLGNRTPAEVDETFFFFKSGLIAGVVEAARAKAGPAEILGAHLGAADDFAVATYGAVDPPVLEAFATAALRVVDALPTGRWPLVDGYRAQPMPGGVAASAYRGAVVLRELRGGIHREAVEAAGLSAAVACQFDRGDDYYRLHGFGDDDRVPETPATLATRVGAEQATDAAVAALLVVLDERGLEDLVAGAELLAATGPEVVLPGT
jgi:hypothetical protein